MAQIVVGPFGHFFDIPDTALVPDLQTFVMHWRTIARASEPQTSNNMTARMANIGFGARRREGRHCLALLYRGLRATVSRRRSLSTWRRRVGLLPWGTVRGTRTQVSHVHPDGWHSGVNAAVPLVSIMTEGENRNGWIEFGRSQTYPKSKAVPRLKRSNLSRAPLSVPSHFYHRTIPFNQTEAHQSCLWFTPRITRDLTSRQVAFLALSLFQAKKDRRAWHVDPRYYRRQRHLPLGSGRRASAGSQYVG